MSIKLTDEQRAIVEHEGGHAKVLAVAGSGKTFTMCHRINYLVKHKKVNPKRIRVLMFNRLAKDSFIKNLEELGFDEDSVPYVATFHGFAYQYIMWLTTNGYIPKRKFWIEDAVEQGRLLLHHTIQELRKDNLIPKENDPEGEFDSEEIMRTIGLYKGALISPENAGHYFNEYIPLIYKKFEENRVLENALTFDDFVPMVVSSLINNDELRKQWSGKADYLIIDEYQDINFGQQKMIELLAGNNAEVMVVGDDDQTIYEWRGARPNYIIRDFMTVFSNKPHSTYRLSYSFRFGPIVAQTAQNSILHNTNRVNKELIAFNPDLRSKVAIKRAVANSISGLHREMGHRIIRLVKGKNVPPSEIWVLGRMYSQLVSAESTFLTLRIPYKILGGQPFFKRLEIRKILSYLAFASNLDKPITEVGKKNFIDILNYPNRKITKSKIATVLNRLIGNQISWLDFFEWVSSEDGILRLDFYSGQRKNLDAFIRILRHIFELEKGAESGLNMGGLIQELVNEINLFEHFDNYFGEGEASFDRKAIINEFITLASSHRRSIDQFVRFIQTLDPTRGAPEEQLITLSTIHRTKGLEFDYVFIPNCNEGFMPYLSGGSIPIYDKRDPKKEAEPSLAIENERRLFYVGLTRVKKEVYITTVEPDQSNPTVLPSRFLEEIQYDICVDLLEKIDEILLWSNEEQREWLKKVHKYSGHKSLIRNVEKYLIKQLGANELLQEVAKINAANSESPFKYKFAYKNLEQCKKDEKNQNESGKDYWGDVLEI